MTSYQHVGLKTAVLQHTLRNAFPAETQALTRYWGGLVSNTAHNYAEAMLKTHKLKLGQS